MAKQYSKGTRVIDKSGKPPKGIVIGHSVLHGRSFTCVAWDDGKIQDWPTTYLKKVTYPKGKYDK